MEILQIKSHENNNRGNSGEKRHVVKKVQSVYMWVLHSYVIHMAKNDSISCFVAGGGSWPMWRTLESTVCAHSSPPLWGETVGSVSAYGTRTRPPGQNPSLPEHSHPGSQWILRVSGAWLESRSGTVCHRGFPWFSRPAYHIDSCVEVGTFTSCSSREWITCSWEGRFSRIPTPGSVVQFPVPPGPQ